MFTPHHGKHTPLVPRWALPLLLLSTVGTTAFGGVLVLFPSVAEAFFNRLMFGSAAYPDGFGDPAVPYVRFVYGVLGAVMVGWGVGMTLLAAGPIRRGSLEAWWMVTFPLLAWFIPDTALSLATAHAPNAVLNSVFGVAFAVPLAALYGPLRRSNASGAAVGNAAGGGDFQRR